MQDIVYKLVPGLQEGQWYALQFALDMVLELLCIVTSKHI